MTLPSAPSPDVFDRMMDDLIAEAQVAKAEYRWLYPSAYSKGRKGNNEKTRRDVSGVGGGIDELVAGGDPDKDNSETLTNRVKSRLEQAGDHARKSLAHMKGAGTANSKAQEDVDRAAKVTLVAADPLEHSEKPVRLTTNPITGLKDDQDARLFPPMTPSEARSEQARRNARLQWTALARRRRQTAAISTVIRSARALVEKDASDAPAVKTLATAIEQFDDEARTVSVPWASEERVG